MNLLGRLLLCFSACIALVGCFGPEKSSKLPLVAIANYGPAPSLQDTVVGIKQGLAARGFRENETVRFDIQNVAFDQSHIPQLISHLHSEKPQALVVISTPIAQYAKGSIHDIPLIFSDVTDPVSAGLLKNENQVDGNMTGSSDRQNMDLVLHQAQQLLPKAHRVGFLYSTSEANDHALLNAITTATQKNHLELIALPINDPKEIPQQMQQFKNRIDYLYIGNSGAIQPSLPVIASIAKQQCVPIFNADSAQVAKGLAYASYGVNYHEVGVMTGEQVADVLNKKPMSSILPRFPSKKEHQAFVGSLPC